MIADTEELFLKMYLFEKQSFEKKGRQMTGDFHCPSSLSKWLPWLDLGHVEWQGPSTWPPSAAFQVVNKQHLQGPLASQTAASPLNHNTSSLWEEF